MTSLTIKKISQMLWCASLCLVLVCCCVPARAQRRGQKRTTHAPLKKQTDLIAVVEPDKSLEEGGFVANFPDVPKRSVFKDETEGTSSQMIQYILTWDNAEYHVDFQDYRAPMTDPLRLRASYDAQVQQLRANPKFKMMRERDVTLDGRLGRELVFEFGHYLVWMRRFIVNQRNYKIFLVVPKAGADAAPLVSNWERKASAFLDSFKVVKLPPPILSAEPDVNLPANFHGTLKDTTYTNEFFGFSLSIPPSWHVLNEKQKDISLSKGVELAEEASKSKLAKENLSIMLGVTSLPFGEPNNSTFMLMTERLPSASMKPSEYARDAQNVLRADMPDLILHEIHPIKLGGMDFVRYTAELKTGGVIAKQKIYVTTRKGFGVLIYLIYVDEKDAAALDAIVDSLKFR